MIGPGKSSSGYPRKQRTEPKVKALSQMFALMWHVHSASKVCIRQMKRSRSFKLALSVE